MRSPLSAVSLDGDYGMKESVSAPLASFAAITRRVIARDGFEGYLPTALFPARKHVVVLEGVPEGEPLETVALAWALSNAAGGEEFLVAFKVSPTHFKVIRRVGLEYESELFSAHPLPLPS